MNKQNKKSKMAHDLVIKDWNGYRIRICLKCGLWRPIEGYLHPCGWTGVITNYKKCKEWLRK